MKGAIFDIDGTILDSMSAWWELTVRYFGLRGVSLSDEENDKIQKMTLEEGIPYIQSKYLPNISMNRLFDEFRAMTADAYANRIPPKPGVCEYIHRLHEDGIKIAAATSGFPELCSSAFKRIGIIDCFDAYAYSSEVGCGKDRPDIYLLAAKRLGLEPGDCVVYEDIITGITSAKAAGFATVAVEDPTNARDKERLIRRSDRYITGWNELLSRYTNGHS